MKPGERGFRQHWDGQSWEVFEATENGGKRLVAGYLESEADARLLAYGRDLLAALISIRDYARDSRTGLMLTADRFQNASAAIARATCQSD